MKEQQNGTHKQPLHFYVKPAVLNRDAAAPLVAKKALGVPLNSELDVYFLVICN